MAQKLTRYIVTAQTDLLGIRSIAYLTDVVPEISFTLKEGQAVCIFVTQNTLDKLISLLNQDFPQFKNIKAVEAKGKYYQKFIYETSLLALLNHKFVMCKLVTSNKESQNN